MTMEFRTFILDNSVWSGKEKHSDFILMLIHIVCILNAYAILVVPQFIYYV